MKIRAHGARREVAEHEQGSIHEAHEKNLEEVFEADLLNQIEAVFTENSMEDRVAVVRVGDALHPELDGRLDRHEETEEKSSVGQHVAEPM